MRVDRNAFLCPMHPERLICDAENCIPDHYAAHHRDEIETARCFVCEEKVRNDFTPVFAEVQLHRNINVAFTESAMGLTNLSLAYGDVLLTLPVTYLCPRHSDLLELPIRSAWPITMDGVSPEDAIKRR